MSGTVIAALVIPPHGPARLEQIEPDVEAIRRLLDGGWLEGIGGDDGWFGYCDEEGKIKGLPLNRAATNLARALGWPSGDVLCGPVVFVGPPDEDGIDTGITSVVLAYADALGLAVPG